MTRCWVAACILVLTIMLLMLRLQPVNSQDASSGVHMVAGVVVVKPSIDGLWQQGEWDDANEYRLSSIYYQVNMLGEAYVRCKHDNTSLYWLIDVPSDNGSTYTRGGQNLTGTATFYFIPSYLGFVITPSGNSTLLTFLSGTPTYSSQISVAQQIGVSLHSSKLHRAYEISMPFEPLLQYNNTIDDLPAVSLDLTVTDSYGNGLDLSGPPYISVLEFGVVPVPENIEPLIPLALAILTLAFCLRRKGVTHTPSTSTYARNAMRNTRLRKSRKHRKAENLANAYQSSETLHCALQDQRKKGVVVSAEDCRQQTGNAL